MLTNKNQIIISELSFQEKTLYSLVKSLLLCENRSFSTHSKNNANYFVWSRHSGSDGKNIAIIGGSSTSNQSYIIKIKQEYDNPDSKFTNFDNVIIHLLNWHNNELDEYLKIKSRKTKLILIKKNDK